MTVIGIVGGHNREALQALVNPLLEKGGVTELRILRLGNNDLIQALVHELILIHECRIIVAVELEDFIVKDDINVEVS